MSITRYVMLQSHPTMGPVWFLAPVRFLARKSEWSACRNVKPVLFSWSNQAMGPVRVDTSVHLWFDWIIHRTPPEPCAMPMRTSYGSCMGIPNVFHILLDPYRPVRDPQGHRMAPLCTRKGIDTYQNSQKSRMGVVHGRTEPYGPLTVPARAVHRWFMSSKPVRGW